MKTCFYYWLIEPLREEFRDTNERTPVFQIPVQIQTRKCSMAVFVDENGIPEYAKLTMPDFALEEIPEDIYPAILAMRGHLESVLRLTYHPEASLFERPIWAFVEDLTKYSIGLSMKAHFGEVKFDAPRARNVFVGAFEHREEIRLFLDGADRRIPLQYRFLSLYKLLEMQFKVRGRWRSSELEVFLADHKGSFESRGISAVPSAYLHNLRDKCAHIRTGNKRESLGVTHLNQKKAAKVENILPVLSEIAVEILKLRGAGKFKIEKRKWM